MEQQRTFVLLKPDAVERRLVGELVQRLEQKDLDLVALKLMRVDKALAERHYAEHREKPFFKELIGFITRGPVVAMVVEGPQAITVVRQMMGATNPFQATAGTIRGDLGLDLTANLIHGSDSPESAKKEIERFFQAEELIAA
ncbi:MAG: nucleoside-diphosphate kinase [Candidatus Fraserbacteria bacterium RBG_16_55_9]|uniref:Nucleoside diphosphate kinase n=1 Tax=Fraserbacteria sp. (strain RBG_16_55_9) TaxID=1817864 RepID=A0A1F5V2T0_FRAXR|nr:MAG: nucleoside-diphosphate kinase [Candidatus Fraserbacteria bacterium RBG_16_55_9]